MVARREPALLDQDDKPKISRIFLVILSEGLAERRIYAKRFNPPPSYAKLSLKVRAMPRAAERKNMTGRNWLDG